jgi:hypothetical protein
MVKRTDVRRWPWTEISVLALAAGISALWYWWLAGGARLAHRHAVAGLAASPGAAASTPTLEQLGQVGDLFGGLNALFAALAFVGVAWAGLLQHRALLSAQEAYRLERQAMVRQQFEQTFFHLLALSRELSQTTLSPDTAHGPPVMVVGRVRPSPLLFDYLAKVVFSAASTPLSVHTSQVLPTGLEPLGCMLMSYLSGDVQRAHASVLGGYFRALYQLFSLIDGVPDEVMSPTEKARYANIVRGQIPESAVLLLAVNALTDRGCKLAAVIDRHGLLKYLPPRHRPEQSPLLARVYHPTAFIGFQDRRLLVADDSLGNDIDQTRACLLKFSRGDER